MEMNEDCITVSTETIGLLTTSEGTSYIGVDPIVTDPYSQLPEETKTHLIYTLPYPGLSGKEIDVYVRGDMLVVDHDESSDFVDIGKIEIDVNWKVI